MRVPRGSKNGSARFRRNSIVRFLQVRGVLYPQPVGPGLRRFDVRLSDGTTLRAEVYGRSIPSKESVGTALRRIKDDTATVRPAVIKTMDATAERAVVEVFLEDYADLLARASENRERGDE